jgi:hypothetical protein
VALLSLVLAALVYVGVSNLIEHAPFSTGASTSTALNPAIAGEVRAFMNSGASREQAIESFEVQGRFMQAHLVSKLESSMGRAYGGEWFDPSTGVMHVGGTSVASLRRAEAVASRAGLASAVTETSVRSGWAKLESTLKRWNQRLAGLFAHNQLATYLSPQRNSLELELASTVPVSTAAALRHKAAQAGVNVSVTNTSYPNLGIERQESRCANFVSDKAYCDPTIVAGVTIRALGLAKCTAGPAALPAEGKSTATYVLTAGHCIKQFWGGNNVGVWTFEKTGSKEKLVGETVAAKNSNADIGAILVENPGFWVKEGKTPVNPAIAPWGSAEPQPFAVPGQMAPGVGNGACMAGQTSGEKCGTISALNVTLNGVEELVEVEGAASAEGDSGAPWWSTQKASLHWVLGTHVGKRISNGRPVFERLSFGLEQLRAEVDLKLLTTENETR